MIWIDLRHDQWHIRRHTIIFRVAEDGHARLREIGLDLTGNFSWQRGEDDLDTRQLLRPAGYDRQASYSSRHLARQTPARDLPIRLLAMLLLSRQPDQFKPGMILQEFDETLADH